MPIQKKSRAGYEPAKGFPDPLADRSAAPSFAGFETHYPHSTGAVCNHQPVPTDPGQYDPINPTCEKCAKWLKAAIAMTKAQHPWAFEAPPAAEPAK
jgi:hypothetical protein